MASQDAIWGHRRASGRICTLSCSTQPLRGQFNCSPQTEWSFLCISTRGEKYSIKLWLPDTPRHVILGHLDGRRTSCIKSLHRALITTCGKPHRKRLLRAKRHPRAVSLAPWRAKETVIETQESQQKLGYKFQRLREALREAVDNGEWSGRLPGERALARRFGVNAKTISKALTDLATEGLLVRHVGRGTFVAGQDTQNPLAGRRFLMWTCPTEDVEDTTGFDLAKNALHRAGHHLESVSAEPDEQRQIRAGAIPPGRLRQFGGLIIHGCEPSAPLLADLLRRRLPVVLLDCPRPPVRVDSVSTDLARGAFELTEHLIGLGHRRIQIVYRDRSIIRGLFETERGYITALRRYGISPMTPLDIYRPPNTALIDARSEATALIALGSRLGKSLAADESEHRSLTLLARAGTTVGKTKSITSYEVDLDLLVEWGIRLLLEHSPGQRAREVLVPGRFIDRGSTRALNSPATPGPTPALL